MPTKQQGLTDQTLIAVMGTEMKQMAKDIAEIKIDLKGQYVTQAEIKIMRALVYGAAGSILIGFMGGVTAFFLRSPTL